jgi:hypothetical protein
MGPTALPPAPRGTHNRTVMVTFYIAVAAAILGSVALFQLYRPWQLRWGSTGEELSRPMPGDEIVNRPMFDATRAVTINARPEDIWPWLVQIGFGRAGWYSYDLLDNFGRHSAERIVPALQHMEPGDLVPIGPGPSSGMWVKSFVQDRWILWWSKKNDQTTWAWALYQTPDGMTRLVARVRAPYSWRQPLSLVWLPLLELADFPMMRKCLLGIKRRAETQRRATVLRPESRHAGEAFVSDETA